MVAASATRPNVTSIPATNSIGKDNLGALPEGSPRKGANPEVSQIFNGFPCSVSFMTVSGPHPGAGAAGPLSRRSGSGKVIFSAARTVSKSEDDGSSGWMDPARTV